MTVSAQTTPMATSHPIPVDLIDPNPEQPREDFNEAELAELAESIKAQGVILPIVVEITDDGSRYILHDGERRLRASKLAGLAEIPAYILELGTDKQHLLIRAVVANLQRSDLSAIEQAKAFQKMHDDFKMSDEQIAEAVGKSRSTITNARRLLNLPEAVQAKVGPAAGQLSERQAIALLPYYQLPEPMQQRFANTWLASTISQPENYTSDDIRDRIARGIAGMCQEFKLFKRDETLGGPGVRHSQCTGCKLLIKINKDTQCGDSNCYEAKVQVWQRQRLEQAKTLTGIDFLDPGRKLRYNESSTFYSSEQPALDQALAHKCPHLLLKCETFAHNNYPRPEGASEYIHYICLHPGRSDKSCKCRQALTADKSAQEKADKAECQRIKDATIQALVDILVFLPLPMLKAIGLHICVYSMKDKITRSTEPEFVAKHIAKVLIERVTYSNNPAHLQETINKWLKEIGNPISAGHMAEIRGLDGRLARIEAWTQELPKKLPTLDAVRGNLSNISRIAEEAQALQDGSTLDAAEKEELAKIFAGIDQVKRLLLDLTVLIDQERDQIEIEHVSWFLNTPPGDVNFKGHLKEANAATLRYTLALVEPEGNKVRIEDLQRRLRALEKQEEEMLPTANTADNGHNPRIVVTIWQEELDKIKVFVRDFFDSRPNPPLVDMKNKKAQLANLASRVAAPSSNDDDSVPLDVMALLEQIEQLHDHLDEMIAAWQPKLLQLNPQGVDNA